METEQFIEAVKHETCSELSKDSEVQFSNIFIRVFVDSFGLLELQKFVLLSRVGGCTTEELNKLEMKVSFCDEF